MLPLGATRNFWGSGGQGSDTPGVPGVGWGRSSGQKDYPQVLPGTWSGSPPKSVQSQGHFSPEQPYRPPLSFLLSLLALTTVSLSPLSFLLLVLLSLLFLFPLLALPLPPPPFSSTARVECHLFIYLSPPPSTPF